MRCRQPAPTSRRSTTPPARCDPTAVVVPVDDQGRICMTSLRNVDVTVDITGTSASRTATLPVARSRAAVRQPLDVHAAQRVDQRRSGSGRTGAPAADRRRARGPGGSQGGVAQRRRDQRNRVDLFLTAYPCGTRPNTSNVNIAPSQIATSNGAMVKLSSGGDLCIYSIRDVHVVVDINGVWL